jgi:hypothetical protein
MRREEGKIDDKGGQRNWNSGGSKREKGKKKV